MSPGKLLGTYTRKEEIESKGKKGEIKREREREVSTGERRKERKREKKKIILKLDTEKSIFVFLLR